MNKTHTIKLAIEILGGQTEAARKLGPPLRQGHISNWIARGKVPREYIGAIEHLTEGKVRAEQLDDEVEWIRVNGIVTGYHVRLPALTPSLDAPQAQAA